MEKDEEAASHPHGHHLHHSFTHFWHREASKRALYGPEAVSEGSSRQRETNILFRNGALSEFGPALVDKMDTARKRQKDLYNDPVAFYTAFHNLMAQFTPDTSRDPNDATAGALGYIMYIWRTKDEAATWKLRSSEVPLSKLLFDRKCLTDDFQAFKEKEGVEEYELRWLHLPANNMEWVEHAMHRIVETLVKKSSDVDESTMDGAVDHVVHHILHPKRWTARQNDRSPEMLHARFMDPLAQQFTVASKTTAPEFAALRRRSFVLFMPYMSWERSTVAMYRNIIYSHARADAERLTTGREGRVRVPSELAIQNTAKVLCCEREALLRNYLFAKRPLHLRRTLDQSYYTIMTDTRHRDEDQVVERYARKQTHWNLRDRLDPCLLMVDYLWLWVLNKDTVVTCFSKAWNHNTEFEGSDLFERMQERIIRKLNQDEAKPGKIRIARKISETCALYLKKMSKTSKCHEFMRFFNETLKRIKDEKSRFHRNISTTLRSDQPEYDESFLDISREFKVLGEIMDITDEIQMILNVIDEQLDIMTKLDEDLVRTRVGPDKGVKAEWRVLMKVKRERKSWENIMAKANEARNEIRDLVELKQQHATIKLATDTSDQSNSVMLFTVVTIIFLPLSTLASIFGVNASEFGQGDLPLRTIFAYIFPLSVVIIILTVWLAFNHEARHCVTLSMEIIIARLKLYIPTGIFDSSAQSLANHLQDLKERRKAKCDARMELKKKRQLEAEEREKMKQDKRKSHPGRQLSNISTDDDDNEFEEDSNVDILEDDATSTSAGTVFGDDGR